MSNSRYYTAQICLNGHVVTDSVEDNPEDLVNYCEQCGSKTITNCPNCNVNIRGDYRPQGTFFSPEYLVATTTYKRPSFCHSCGSPFPWIKSRLEAAEELADIQENLTLEEREVLKKSINNLVKDTPRTTVEVTKFKQLVTKAGAIAAQGFRDILVDVISEAAKKMIWSS